MRPRFFLLPCLALSLRASAQDAPPPTSGPVSSSADNSAALALPQVLAGAAEPEIALDELLRRALASNPALTVAREEQAAATERVGAAQSRLAPTLQIVPGIGGTRNARDEEIILSQPLDLFGLRRSRAAVAQAEVRRAQAQANLAQRGLIVQVRQAAAELFAAQETEALNEAQVEIAAAFRDAATRRAQLGDAPPVQAQRAELELARTQNELSNARAEREARRALLNQLIGQAPESLLCVASPLDAPALDLLRAVPRASIGAAASAASSGAPASPAASADLGVGAGAPAVGASSQLGSDLVAARASLQQSLSSRPDVAGAQAALETRRAQVQVLATSRRPQVELQLRRGAVFSSGGSLALRAVVTVPLGMGAARGERRALEAEARAQQAQASLLRSQAAAQAEGALVRLRQSRQSIELYRARIVPQALDLLRKTQLGYAQGASSYLEVLEAQRATKAVQSEYLQALVSAQRQQAALENALGADLPAALASPSGGVQ